VKFGGGLYHWKYTLGGGRRIAFWKPCPQYSRNLHRERIEEGKINGEKAQKKE